MPWRARPGQPRPHPRRSRLGPAIRPRAPTWPTRNHPRIGSARRPAARRLRAFPNRQHGARAAPGNPGPRLASMTGHRRAPRRSPRPKRPPPPNPPVDGPLRDPLTLAALCPTVRIRPHAFAANAPERAAAGQGSGRCAACRGVSTPPTFRPAPDASARTPTCAPVSCWPKYPRGERPDGPPGGRQPPVSWFRAGQTARRFFGPGGQAPSPGANRPAARGPLSPAPGPS
ncbi:hypothetical protein FALB51S_02100 [Frigidibacter albus]|uniref:Uncharacterized protein n=1 Tax=Frigidibacter mobilis TaxID=1335048 RepID=A0A159Z0T2_9RHOB|nr:hypothetical protein AKL17_1161 [Frigidibacter mobilis]